MTGRRQPLAKAQGRYPGRERTFRPDVYEEEPRVAWTLLLRRGLRGGHLEATYCSLCPGTGPA